MREAIRDKARLEHIVQAIDYVEEFTRGVSREQFSNDVMRRFAVIKNIEIIGEASYMLTNEFRDAHGQVPWRKIIAMRHVLVHGYCQINDDFLWLTIQEELAPLKSAIQSIIEAEFTQ